MTDTLPRGTILPETAAFDATTTNAPSADIQSAEALPAPGTAPVLSSSPTERGYGGCMGLAAAATAIPNLPAYLATRSNVPSYKSEPALFSRLPESLRHEVKIWQAAFDRVSSLCSSRLGGSNHSIQSACKLVLSDSIALKGTPLKTFRGKYDLWAKSQDWLTLVNRTRAGADWTARDDGLPAAFIEQVCAPHFARFKRWDGKRQAIFAIKRWWKTGRDLSGAAKPIPGYESIWATRNPEMFPLGWHYSNILRQIKARAKFTRPSALCCTRAPPPPKNCCLTFSRPAPVSAFSNW
jgi:hypothetical protein